jgi:hypothetical protein
MYDVYSKEERVGSVYVDAGIVMLGDPCYTLPDDASSRNEIAKSWPAFCDALYGQGEQRDVWTPFGEGTAIVVNSGYGDGEYPVYVTRKNGCVMSLRVDFDDNEPMGEEFARWEDEDGH